MADTQSNIQVNIDTTQALASIKNLQRQISAFHSSMAKGGAAANAVSTQLQQTLINSINATGQFSAGIRTIRTTTESFTDSLEKNKFSLGQYFRYAGGATKTFGRLFKTEHDTINKVARENVKDLQTQYIRLGRDASGAMKSIAVRPLALDMTDLGTRTQIAAQKQAILNQLLKQGSTNLLNFGKNTQWAGRQLMVGFTLPLIAVGSAASKTFMDMEAQAIRFKKVYGDLFTPTSESQAALKDIQELGKEFTKYGIAVSTTVGLAAEAAAAGFKGVDLQRQTAAATRLSILGQVESQKALETTISLQNAFAMSSENLAESIDFLNAVENQTVLSLDDISTAIPKAAPVVQQLGGDVKDLAFLMTAMKEGGINASEGANALKSGLASLINPTGKANDMLLSFGINAKKIVLDNKGDLKKTVVEFATALNMLDPLNRAQAIEQMFGKFQFARLSTLFANVTKEGTQASRVLDLAGASVQELAGLAEKELGMTSESAMNKFKGAVENLKLSLIPLGEQFLKAVTPIAEFLTKVLDKFNGFSDNTKKIIVVLTGIVAGLGPVLLMTVGLVMNGLANMIKLFAFLKSSFNKTGQATTVLGTEVQYMTTEQRNAVAVAASLDQVHTKLAQTFTSEASAVNALTRAYQRAIAAQSQFVPVGPPITRGPIKKFATGKPATVGGTGNTDSELALLMPGETVIPTAMSKKYAPLINAMIAGNIPGYEFGKTRTVASHIEGFTPGQLVPTLSDPIMKKVLSVLPDVGVSVQVLSTTADGLVTVSGAIETSLQNLATTLSENNVENATAIGTGEFAGTTTPTSSERNLMLNSAGIAGEPLTFEQAQEASGRAQAYVDKPVANETDNTRAQKEEARRLVQEQVEFERSLVGLSQQEAEAKKLDFTRTKATQALEYTLMQKGLSAEEASTVAKQKIAEADKAVEQLTKKAKTDLEKRKIKEAAYQATLLKEMGAVAGYDEKKTKTTVFNRTQLNAVPRDMAKGQVQFGTPYAPGEKVPSGAAVFGSGKSFMGVKGKRVSRSQSAVVDLSSRDAYYADREKIRSGFKKQGSDAAKAFQDGFKSVKTPDPYVGSRDRQSPHRLAAKDGRDDARAYAEARDKEAKRQSGRARRAATRPQGPAVAPVVTKTPRKPGPATRPQGPAPIGATPQPGMTILPIVPIGPDTPPDPNAKPKTTIKGIAGKMTGMGGGMGLLGLNMGISMLPDFAGKNVVQGGLAGANLGMMFGPYGMAAGAAIGLVTTALGNLIEKQKQYKAMTEAMFKSSASVAEFFGNAVVNTTLEVGRLSSATLAASSSTENLAKNFGYTNEELKRFSDLVNSLPKGDPLKDVLVGLEDVSDPEEIKRIIENFVTTQVAVGQTLPEQAQKIYDLILAQSGNQSMVGQSFYNFKTQSEAVSATLKNASKNSVDLGNSLIQLTGAASNSSSLIFIKSIIDGIATSTISAAQGLNAMYYAYLRIGNQGAADSLQNLRRIQGLTLAEINDLMISGSQGFYYPVGKDTTREQILKAQAEFKKTLKEEDPVESGIKPYQDVADEKTSSIKKEIDLLKKRKKIIDDQIKKEKQITDELKKQNDYRDKQLKIDKDIVEAKIRGDYIQAAILLQEKTSLTDEFNKENQLSALQARSDALQQQIEERQSVSDDMVAAIQSTTQAVTTGSENIVEAVKQAGGFPSTDGDGSFKAPFTVASDQASIKSYIESEKPSAGITNEGTSVGTVKPSAIDAAKAYDETFGEKYTRLTQPGLKTEMQMLEDYIRTQLVFPPDKKYLFVEIKGGDGLFYKFKVAKDKNAKDGFIRVGNPIEKASGGAIRGAGTGTSDSIPALLSNGEYVIKAKSVKKYGVGTLDALNAGRFATGGQVGRSASSYIPRLNNGGLIPTFGSGGIVGNIIGGIGKFIAKLFGGKKIVKPKPQTTIIPKLGSLSPAAMAKLTPEERAFHFAGTDLDAMKTMLTSDVSSMSVPITGVSFNPNVAEAGLAYIKSGLGRIPGASSKEHTAKIWEFVQSQREALLTAKYPKADLSDVKTFNELYAKEFYGLGKDDLVTIFKGTRTTKPAGPGGALRDWRTHSSSGSASLDTYFSTNPYIAAEYAARISDPRTLGSELPMFSMNLPVSQLKSRFGEGAIRDTMAQGSFEFPQVVDGAMLAAQTPKPYYLPTQVYGQMFPPRFGNSTTKVEGWPFNFANGGLIPGYAGGGIVGKLLGGIGKAISKLFVGKSMGKPIKPNEVEKFLSDTLGDVSLPTMKRQELGPGVAGQYIPRFSDPASNYENALPFTLFSSDVRTSGNTAVHETMHHFDLDVLHDSFKKTLAKLRRDGKGDLADQYESTFVTAEMKQKGTGERAWSDLAFDLNDFDSLAYSGGAAEAFAEESTFKAYTKFMSSPKIKDKQLALKIGNPYGPGYKKSRLRGYFDSYSQFESNALNVPMRLEPSFLRGLVESSPNMPQATKDRYLAWAEGLQRFRPPVRSNPDEIRNSLQFQNFRKYITDNKLDKAEGFHDGGPVGHKHPSTSYSPAPMSDAAKETMKLRAKLIKSGAMSDSLPKTPYYEQYDPRTGKAFTFPTDDEYIYDYDQLIPPSMRSKKPWYEPFKRMTNLAQWGIGNDLRGKEMKDGVVDLPYKAYKNIIFPTITWADRVAQLQPLNQAMRMLRFSGVDLGDMPYLTSTNRNQEAEWIKRSQEEGFGSVAPEMALQQGLDIAGLLPWNRIGGAIGNVGISKTVVARIAAEKAAEKAALKAYREQNGIGTLALLQSIKSNFTPEYAKNLKLRSKFEAIKAEGKILTPEGEMARYELAISDALIASRKNNFTPLMHLKNATPEQLIAEHKALPSLIEEPFELNGKSYVFRFHKAALNDGDTRNIEYFLNDIKTSNGFEMSDTATGFNLAEIIDPSTGMQAAYIRYDPITGHIRRRETDVPYRMKHLSAALYNKAAEITRIRHSAHLTQSGRASSPLIGGFMSHDNIFNIPGMVSSSGPSSLTTFLQKFIPKPKKPKKPKEQELTTSDSNPADYSGFGLTDEQWADYQARNNPSGSSIAPNTSAFADNSPEATARREALQAETRARAQANFDNNQDALLAAWRGNLYRTYNTYPFNPYNGAYDLADDYDLEMLMQLRGDYRNAPAQVPWRDNSQRPAPVTFPGKPAAATGGFLDKGKLRVPKFANGGLIKGPGTGISDSIQAGFGYAGGGSIRVSNGEYVVKASSVRDYGVKTMDAINNGTARVGTESGGTVYNINMPVTSNNANPEIVANEVMRKLKLEISKNNKTNKVGG